MQFGQLDRLYSSFLLAGFLDPNVIWERALAELETRRNYLALATLECQLWKSALDAGFGSPFRERPRWVGFLQRKKATPRHQQGRRKSGSFGRKVVKCADAAFPVPSFPQLLAMDTHSGWPGQPHPARFPVCRRTAPLRWNRPTPSWTQLLRRSPGSRNRNSPCPRNAGALPPRIRDLVPG